MLLDVNETCLRSQGFFDLWKQQKQYENDAALNALAARLVEIDALPDDHQRWTELCLGVLAGKYFKLIPTATCCTFSNYFGGSHNVSDE